MSVIDLTEYRNKKADDVVRHQPEFMFAVLAMCLSCDNRWVGGIEAQSTSLFTLECPMCSVQDSFATIIPEEYLKHFGIFR